jgi:hypothetical protein
MVLLLSCAAGAQADCVCRFAGGSVAPGLTACIQTAKGQSLARCGMNQNVTSWIVLDQPCPQASVEPSPKPADNVLETRLVDVPDRVIN